MPDDLTRLYQRNPPNTTKLSRVYSNGTRLSSLRIPAPSAEPQDHLPQVLFLVAEIQVFL